MTTADLVVEAEGFPEPGHAQAPTAEAAASWLTRPGGARFKIGARSGIWAALVSLMVAGVLIVGCTTTGASSSGVASSTGSFLATTRGSIPKVVIETGNVIDGFTLGVRVECSGPVGSVPSGFIGCASYPDLAIAALDARDQGHAAIVATAAFTDATQAGPIDVTGGASPSMPVSVAPGNVVTVFVFTLADGSVRATGVRCSESGHCVAVAGATTP